MAYLSTSVALCTCNGSKYIHEQIQSIIQQSIPVDEIVICDDLSDDDTIPLLESDLSKSGIAYRIIINEKRLGPGLNFQKCIGLCKGDIVFLSDQDDIWMAEKVASFIQAFQNESVVCAFSDANTIDGHGRTVEESLLSKMVSPNHFPDAMMPKWLPDTMARVQKTPNGCLMAIRRVPYLAVLNDPCCLWHDGWLFHVAAAIGEYAYINQKLISYRVHENNLTSSQQKQTEYLSKLEDCDTFDKYFGLNCFCLARISLFEHVIDFQQNENQYLMAYKKRIAITKSLQEIKKAEKFRGIYLLLFMYINGSYKYRYCDPFKPKGLVFQLRLLSMLKSDILFLLRKNNGIDLTA